MSSVHPPYDTRIFLKECTTLCKEGYDVTYVVAMPADAERNGVKFVSVPREQRRLRRMTKTARAVYKAALKLDADLYHFHDPELIPWGLMLRLRGKKVVIDIHEEAGYDMLEKHWIWKPLRYGAAWGINFFEWLGSVCFNGIIASRPALYDRFPKRKTALVNNFPILGELDSPGSVPFSERPRLAVYVGAMGEVRGFFNMIDGLGALPEDFEMELHVAGLIHPESLLDEAKSRKGFERMKIHGVLGRKEVSEMFAKARYGVVFFHAVGNNLRSFPTKLFEYASAGLPTLGTDIPHWVNIIEKEGLGFCVNIEDPKAIAERYMWMMDHPAECEQIGAKGRMAIENKYNWDLEAARLVELYEQILK